MSADDQRRRVLNARAQTACAEWFAATDPQVADNARRRYRRALAAIERDAAQ